MEKGRWLQRIPLGGGLQAPDNWIRYGVPVARLATGHPRRKGNAVDKLTVITSAPRRQVSERTQLTGGGGMPALFSWPEPSRAVDSSSSVPRGLLGWSRIGAQ